MSEYFLQVRTGDILLTRSHTLSGKINAAYQRIRRRKERGGKTDFVPTHAALALSSETVIHSNKLNDNSSGRARARLRAFFQLLIELCRAGLDAARRHPARKVLGYGVTVDALADFIRELSAQDILLLRHPDLQNRFNPNLFSSLFQESLYHVDMPYNFLVELSEGKGTAVFCSQLVYQVFAGVGIDIPKGAPKRVLPIDLLIWARRDGWKIADGEELFKSFARRADFETGDSARNVDMIQMSVKTHRAVVERVRELKAANATILAFNQKMAEWVSKLEPARFSVEGWMQMDAIPVPITSKGLLIAADQVSKTLGVQITAPELSPAADDTASDKLSDGWSTSVDKPMSWLLVNLPERDNVKIEDRNAQEETAIRFLNFADDVLDELERAAQAALSILKEALKDQDQGKFSESPKLQFLQSQEIKRLLYVAQFIGRSGEFDALEAQQSDVTQRQEIVEGGLREDIDKIRSFRAGNESEQKSAQQAAVDIRTRMHLLCLYAIASDFASAAQWLKAYDGDTSLENSIRFLADRDCSELVQCLEALGSLPKSRIEIRKPSGACESINHQQVKKHAG
jgi:hypothetical protein